MEDEWERREGIGDMCGFDERSLLWWWWKFRPDNDDGAR